MFILLFLVILVPTASSTGLAEQWDTIDRCLLTGLIAVQTLDYLQTKYIFEHGDRFHETNAAITEQNVDLYFAIFALLESLIAHELDSGPRKTWLGVCILGSAICVTGNMALGIGFSF